MKSVYVCSVESYSGKSAVSLALALHFKDSGQSVGYIKPVGTLPLIAEDKLIDEDVYSMYAALDKKDPLELMSPVILSSYVTDKILGGKDIDAMNTIVKSVNEISKDKDILIYEGASNLERGGIAGASAYDISERLGLKVLLTVKAESFASLDKVLTAAKRLGDKLLGVLFISVPRSKRDVYEKRVVPYLEKQGVRSLGLLPREKLLTAVSVAQLEEVLNGRILSAPNARDNLVETFLVGAMGQERALRFFRKKVNKAVITGGDRADLQMAALETPTKCIILTGNLEPTPSILGRAEELNVPLLLVEDDTWTTIEKIEKLTGRLSIEKPVQLAKMRELMKENFDYGLLERSWKESD